MSVVGAFSVPASGFALADALSAVPEMTVRADLAQEVAASEHDRPPDEGPAETVERVSLSLSHVPKLEDAGVVEHHSARAAVSLSAAAADLTRLLEAFARP